MDQFDNILKFIRTIFPDNDFIPLHAPIFKGREKEYVLECIDSTYVSSVGKFVDRFERMMEDYTGARFAVATVNGTAALHLALLIAGVKPGDEVITQAVSFVATANAIAYCSAHPVFLDSDRETLGLSPVAMEAFIHEHCTKKSDGYTYNKDTGRKIAACVPMHVFGHPVEIDKIESLCEGNGIILVEDAAESIGSLYRGRHTGTFGKLGVLSFNGNKIITTGGGGMILTNDENLGRKAKHLSTTAKIPHSWEFVHDHIGFNYRLPNINAALGCAQMESLPSFIDKKRELASMYQEFFDTIGMLYISEPKECRSNYWLNTILLNDKAQKDTFLEHSNANGVMTRPLWTLLPRLQMYKECYCDNLKNATWLEERLVCLPSSVRI